MSERKTTKRNNKQQKIRNTHTTDTDDGGLQILQMYKDVFFYIHCHTRNEIRFVVNVMRKLSTYEQEYRGKSQQN